MGRIIDESVLCYGSKVRALNTVLKKTHDSSDGLSEKKLSRTSRLEQTSNKEIRTHMYARETVVNTR